MLFFFKQKTAYEMRISDWSSDVCSSDLLELFEEIIVIILDLHVGVFGGLGRGIAARLVEGDHRRAEGASFGHADGRERGLVIGRGFLGFERRLDRKSTRLNSSH